MAQFVLQVTAPSSDQTLLWQTSTGVISQVGQGSGNEIQEDPAVDPASGIFRAGTLNDPVPIIITNQDATNPVYLGGMDVTGPTNGTPLAAGESITRNVVGNDSEFVAGNGNSVEVSVQVGRQ